MSEKLRAEGWETVQKPQSETAKRVLAHMPPEWYEARNQKIRHTWSLKTPEERSAVARKSANSMTPEQRSERAKKGWERSTPERRKSLRSRNDEYWSSPKNRHSQSIRALKTWKEMTPERRAARETKRAATRRKNKMLQTEGTKYENSSKKRNE